VDELKEFDFDALLYDAMEHVESVCVAACCSVLQCVAVCCSIL